MPTTVLAKIEVQGCVGPCACVCIFARDHQQHSCDHLLIAKRTKILNLRQTHICCLTLYSDISACSQKAPKNGHFKAAPLKIRDCKRVLGQKDCNADDGMLSVGRNQETVRYTRRQTGARATAPGTQPVF